MTEAYRHIDPTPYVEGLDPSLAPDLGPLPELRWIPISQLVIDPRYQRDIGRAGAKNVRRIAERFDWTKFGVTIVARLAEDLYAIVDGQHRTTGAAGRGIEAVPCLVIHADPKLQAESFAAINGAVTPMSPLQLHAARLAAGEPAAIALAEACERGGTVICRYPVPNNKIKKGETLAVGILAKQLKLYGADTLSLALRCITGTRDGNPGMIRAAIVSALCAVLDAEPAWRSSERRLLAAMERFDFNEQFEEATAEGRKTKTKVETVLATRLFAHLDAALGSLAA